MIPVEPVPDGSCGRSSGTSSGSSSGGSAYTLADTPWNSLEDRIAAIEAMNAAAVALAPVTPIGWAVQERHLGKSQLASIIIVLVPRIKR